MKSNNRLDILGIEKDKQIIIRYGKRRKAFLTVGEIKQTFVLENFADGSITDKNPLTWWTDTIDPYSDTSIFSQKPSSGFYIWKDQTTWHIRWVGGAQGDIFSGVITAKGGNINAAKYFNLGMLDKKQDDEQKIVFSHKNNSGRAGIDFMADSDAIEFDLRQNDRYLGRSVWIGKSRALAYSIPFVLDNNKITRSYSLSMLKSTRADGKYMMKVVKKYTGKDYPYFGAWGLRGAASNWTNIDDFYFWLYLPADVGNIKVELEDQYGNKGILNGYNPFLKEKGAGWYKWTSNYFNSPEVLENRIDSLPIKARKWWKAWDDNENDFVDTTDDFDLSNIKNIQFVVGGGEKKDVYFYIDELILENNNYRMGNSYPTKISQLDLFQTRWYKVMFQPEATIDAENIFIQIVGKDSNPKNC
ncbi:MAG: hypothetical protein OMM_05447 [Candidatus Magnetoglobus multicellularis str. Araruama]|uniref:Uncharacterized protein n=1 Tax=Candidatus Magnetoglobus multicellularis str. Araruama TaxID=890399 RepID=A0A1V1NWC7_9BACT|nr:MAG: hypothetical protein OMM_05447 [Candidatus Magnetoglobus multicellularis str. Araruama]